MREMDELIEVRMIGPLEVRRADGSFVDPQEWKTAKTRDLFRLLVLEEGRVVRTERILEALWPGVDRAHGAASIRTAASRIRTVTGATCVVRERGGLMARGVRTDVHELHRLVVEARRLHAAGAHQGVLDAVAPHTGLLTGELHADVLDAPTASADTWAESAHAAVGEVQREILTLQAEAATSVGHLHDAVSLARRVIDADPFRERPYRALMRALAGMDEADEALRVFERLRVTLENDLGVEPSPQSCKIRDRIQRERAVATPSADRSLTLVGAPRRPARETSEGTPSVDDPDAVDGSPSPVLRIPAQPGWGDSFERYVLGWLRDRTRGATVRIQASVVGEPLQVFALDITSGIEGLVEIIEDPGPLRASSG